MTWVVVPFNNSFKPGPKNFDFDINQISVTDERDQAVDFSDSYYDVNQALVALNGTPIADAKSLADLKPYQLGAQIGTTSLGYINDTIQPDKDARVYDTSNDVIAAINAKQIDGLVVDLPTAFFLVGAEEVKNGKVVGQFPSTGGQEHFGMLFQEGNTLRDCVNEALADAEGRRHARADPDRVALEQDERSGPRVGDRSSRILGGSGGARSAAIAAVSTVVFFGVLVLVVVNSPNWEEVKEQFFNWDVFKNSFPDIAEAFKTNVKLFLIAEAFILVLALFLAVLRSLPGPVFFPLRVLSTAYTDVFRGIPTILLVYLLGFGIPGLQLSGVPNSQFFWAAVALVLVYSAYVAEVYRAGIESIHPSQSAAARSLGLTHAQSMRYVVLPQAVRRVIPAAPERLHRAAEGHRARRAARRRRGVPPVADRVGRRLQPHAVPRDRVAVPVADDPAHALHRLADRP